MSGRKISVTEGTVNCDVKIYRLAKLETLYYITKCGGGG